MLIYPKRRFVKLLYAMCVILSTTTYLTYAVKIYMLVLKNILNVS
jgi:hypothetical protein